jgi:hypothetical protein
VLDYAARLLPSIAPALAPPRSLRPGVGSLTVRPGGAVADAAREVMAREGSIGVIVPDTLVEEVSRQLDGLAHAVLDPDTTEEHRLLIVPATLAKGLEYDHVIVVEPADIVAAEPRGLARLYVVLTRSQPRRTPCPHRFHMNTCRRSPRSRSRATTSRTGRGWVISTSSTTGA